MTDHDRKAARREIADALVEANPRAIIANQPLPYFPRPLAGSYGKNNH